MRSPARSGYASKICRCRRKNYSNTLNKQGDEGHMRNRSMLKAGRDNGFILVLVILATAFYAWAQSEDELIRGAKKEGKVVFWSSMRIEDSRALAAGFEARFPFIKVDIFRAGGEQIVNRAIAEHLAGKTTYDVLNAFALKVLQKKGLLQPYAAPETAQYPA